VNELRVENGDEEIDSDYARVVLNDKAIQIYMADKNQSSMGGMPGGEGVPAGEGVPGEGEEAEAMDDSEAGMDEESDIDWSEMFKSAEGKTIRVTVQ
jgi:hypothetical protein